MYLSVQMKENCDRMQSITLGMRPSIKENLMGTTKRSLHPLPHPPPQLATPLPKLTWANSLELWKQMRAKDRVKSAPESDLRLRHPSILASMRTILLDWMMEVRLCAERGCVFGVQLLASCVWHYGVFFLLRYSRPLFLVSGVRGIQTSQRDVLSGP